jgi:hypothetical protein
MSTGWAFQAQDLLVQGKGVKHGTPCHCGCSYPFTVRTDEVMTMRTRLGSLPYTTTAKNDNNESGMFDSLGIWYNRIYDFKISPQPVILANIIL